MSSGQILLFCVLSGAIAFGCSFPEPGIHTGISPQTAWQSNRFRQHLQYLNNDLTEGRAPASQGLSRAAIYVSGQFADGMLQPILADEYRMILPGEISITTGAKLEATSGSDTLRWVWGQDFLVDARSGSGEVLVRDAAEDVDFVEGSLPALAVARRGITIVTERPMQSAGRLDSDRGLIFHLFAEPLALLRTWMGRGQQVQLAGVVSRERAVSNAMIHVGALVPGAAASERDSLIVVLAPMDGYGRQGGRQWTDGTDLQLEAVAVIESAIRLQRLQRQWSLMHSSVLFALVSDTRTDCTGPETFLRRIPWENKAVVHVVLPASHSRQAGCDWEELARGISVQFPLAVVSRLSDSAIQEAQEIFDRATLTQSNWLSRSIPASMDIAQDLLNHLLEIDEPRASTRP